MAIPLLPNLRFTQTARREISDITGLWILWGCIASAILAVSLCPAARAQKVYTEDFLNSTFTPETAWQPAITGAFSNWITQPAGFGTGWSGYGYHYGIAISDNVNGKFMRKLAFASLSRHEDKFEPITTGGKWRRISLALTHSVFVSSSSESRTFNWSGLPASLASATLSNAYQPAEQRSVSATFSRFGTNCAGYAAGNVWNQLLQIATAHRVWNHILTNR